MYACVLLFSDHKVDLLSSAKIENAVTKYHLMGQSPIPVIGPSVLIFSMIRIRPNVSNIGITDIQKWNAI
jgi:hypothetical protein